MRRPLLPALAAAVAAAGALAGSAGAWLDPPAPDMGVAGGGYTLINPGNPNVESNRARFEFALRQSQTTGWTRGKLLTIRSTGAGGKRFIVRAWPQLPNPGSPPKPGSPSQFTVNPCAMSVGVLPDNHYGQGEFSAYGAVYEVLPNGSEVPYLDPEDGNAQMTAVLSIVFFDHPFTNEMDELYISGGTFRGPLPFPLPFGTLASGSVGITDGTIQGCLGI